VGNELNQSLINRVFQNVNIRNKLYVKCKICDLTTNPKFKIQIKIQFIKNVVIVMFICVQKNVLVNFIHSFIYIDCDIDKMYT